MTTPKLTIELVPSSSWFDSVKARVTEAQWDYMRNVTYTAGNHHCQICGGRGPTHPVECHERWLFKDDERLQKLLGMTALCPACHEVKHIDIAEWKGRRDHAATHLAKVNEWDMVDAIEYINHAVDVRERRSEPDREVDLRSLDDVLAAHENRRNMKVKAIKKRGRLLDI